MCIRDRVETAVRAGAPVITIVAVDSGWGMERAAHRFKGIDEARYQGTDISPEVRYDLMAEAMGADGGYVPAMDQFVPCLLYTSDAADGRSSVDLGGRRIIKKKKTTKKKHTDNTVY